MPELFFDLQDYWRAFFELHSSRQTGMSVNAIAPIDIVAWLDIHGVADFDERTRYYDFITVMDLAFMKWQRTRNEEKKSDNGNRKRT